MPYLGIDIGTQGLSVMLTDAALQVVGMGQGGYDFVPNLAPGCYEQTPDAWASALSTAMADLKASVADPIHDIECIGISGQMHGEVLVDSDGLTLSDARLWCDHRNEAEADQLTEHFGVKIPKRVTAARWLGTVRERCDIAKRASFITTPAGWLAFQLTGERVIGIGDASGMFPICPDAQAYDTELLRRFDEVAAHPRPLGELLPAPRRCGESGGTLNEAGARLLGLPAGIPVAPAEGDQPAAMAGSLIGSPGDVSISFGTSVCANSVGDRTFRGVSSAIDHFCAVDGKPINMVFLRNGTTYMNCIVAMLSAVGQADGFADIMPQVIRSSPDCGGVMALPFMDDEPGLGVPRGGTGTLIGLNPSNATPGNAAKAALLATMFNLKLGCAELDEQGFPRQRLVLSGGLTKTPELGQVLADVFNCPVTLLEAAEEGTAWGAAVLAKFRHQRLQGSNVEWVDFLTSLRPPNQHIFAPDAHSVDAYSREFTRYRQLLEIQPSLDRARSPE